MSMLKFTTENVIAGLVVLLSTAGSIYNTSYHYGQVTQKIDIIEQKTRESDQHLSRHDDQLSAIREQNATTTQSLSDIKDTVKDIQFEVRRHPRVNN